jgi:hypothetical protein
VSLSLAFFMMVVEADPFGCLASGLCQPNPEGPLPPGTSGLLFTALGLVVLGALVRHARQSGD